MTHLAIGGITEEAMLPSLISRAHGRKRRRYVTPLGQSKIVLFILMVIVVSLTGGFIYLISLRY